MAKAARRARDEYAQAASAAEVMPEAKASEGYRAEMRFNLHAGTLAPSGFGGVKDYADAIGSMLAAPFHAIKAACSKKLHRQVPRT